MKIDIKFADGEEEFIKLLEYYTTIYSIRGEKHKYPTNKIIAKFYTHDQKDSLLDDSKWSNPAGMSSDYKLQAHTSFSSFYSKHFPNSFYETDIMFSHQF